MTTATSRTGALTVALRATTTLAVLGLVWQFVTAGEILPQGGSVEPHAVGAVALHVLTGLAAVAAVVHARATRGPLWPSALAVVVFVLTFVQAYVGDYGTLAVHVPGAVVLTVGSVWLTAWAWMRAG